MAEILECHMYFEEPSGDFPYVFPWDDVLNNTGVTLSTGEQFLIGCSDASSGYERVSVENLFYNNLGTKYGSILGACLVYDDGSKRWIDAVFTLGTTDSEYLSVAIGDWVEGLTYQEAISTPSYKKPLIGFDGQTMLFTFGAADLRVCQLTLSPSPLSLVIGEGSKVITASHGSDVVSSHTWSVDTSKLKIVSSNSTSIQLEGLAEGTYTISLQANYDNNHQCSSSVQVIVSAPPQVPTCVAYVTPSQLDSNVGESVIFSSSQNNSSGVKSYRWTLDETKLLKRSESSNAVEVTSNSEGTFSISYEVENMDGSKCTGTATLNVTQKENPLDFEDPIEPAPPSEPDCGAPTVIGQQPIYKLFPYDEKQLSIKLPNIMKRNARYRGHRESEKTLHDHQEQIYEIRQNWKEINDFSNVLKETINGWFQGEQAKPFKNLTINQSKTFQTSSNKTRYPLIKDGTVRSFSNVVVKLNGIVVDPLNYYFSLGDLVYTSPTSTPQTLTISYTAKIELQQDFNKGIYSVKKRLQVLDERIAEAERRYQDVENAYN